MKRMVMVAGLVIGTAINLAAQDGTQPPAGPGGGQGPGPHGPGPGPHGPPPIIALLDADRDTVLSEAEINAAATKLLELDKDQDGQLSAAELFPGRGPSDGGPGQQQGPPPRSGKGKGKGPGPKGPMGPPPFIQALDADGDRVISSAEISNAPAALFSLDANQDKQLTVEELRPKRGPQCEEQPEQAPPPQQ